jgi:hypothetical protein
VRCGQQSTGNGVAAKTAIVEKPASNDGASFHSGLCQPTHLECTGQSILVLLLATNPVDVGVDKLLQGLVETSVLKSLLPVSPVGYDKWSCQTDSARSCRH